MYHVKASFPRWLIVELISRGFAFGTNHTLLQAATLSAGMVLSGLYLCQPGQPLYQVRSRYSALANLRQSKLKAATPRVAG